MCTKTSLLGCSIMKKLFSATLMLGALAACQPQERSLDILGPVPDLGHGLMEGYLSGEPPLNSAALLPAPPSEGGDAGIVRLVRDLPYSNHNKAPLEAGLFYAAHGRLIFRRVP